MAVATVAEPKYIIGHFDGHGVSAVAARARSLAERAFEELEHAQLE